MPNRHSPGAGAGRALGMRLEVRLEDWKLGWKDMERQRDKYEAELYREFYLKHYDKLVSYRYSTDWWDALKEPVEATPSEPALDSRHEAFVSRVLARKQTHA